MKKSILVVMLIALLSLVPASPALATAPTTGYGWAEFVSYELIDVRTANGITFMTAVEVYTLHGVIEGTYINEFVITIKPDGSFVNRAKAICENCTIEGRTGTVVFRANYHPMIGLFSVVKGSGDLSDLHGQGSIDLTTLIITFNYHFD
ncbi:MAG: hypothetical protein PVI78_04725 [Anaerolineales bacterium]|jgi:hypothetical protein